MRAARHSLSLATVAALTLGLSGSFEGERAQAETINSMLKRNLGDDLRSRKPQRRKNEMLFRTVVHNFTLIAAFEG